VEAIREIQLHTEDRIASIQRSNLSEELTRPTQIRKWLVALAMARGAAMGDMELLMYSKALEEFPDGCISAVLGQLSLAMRGEYEPRIPELGDLLHLVRSEVRKLSRWAPCGSCSSEMRSVERDDKRFAERCGCWMEWIRREAAK
jgi:hypothetical protein